MIMIKNCFTKIIVAGVILIECSPVLAKSYCPVEIKWNRLRLSDKQKVQIQSLDQQWKETNAIIRPALERDKARLKSLISNPAMPDNAIREVQKHIIAKQDQLRYEALENFLAKRRILTLKQRETLHKMLSKQNFN